MNKTLWERICEYFGWEKSRTNNNKLYVQFYSELLYDDLTPKMPLNESFIYQEFIKHIKNNNNDVKDLFAEWIEYYFNGIIELRETDDMEQIFDNRTNTRIG